LTFRCTARASTVSDSVFCDRRCRMPPWGRGIFLGGQGILTRCFDSIDRLG